MKSIPKLAQYVEKSTNKKTGNADVTYASLQSCPKCPFAGDGCYAENYPAAFTVRRLEEEGATALDVAKAEAKAIDESYDGGRVPEGRNLRLHISGDCRSKTAARLVSAAAFRWQRRGGGAVWSYTHAWREVARENWGSVSILASIESPKDARAAIAAGYAPAMVVDEFESDKSFVAGGVRFIPCPAQTKEDKHCDDCCLCWEADDLQKREMGIAFEAHGPKTKDIKRKLKVLQ